MPDKPSMAEEGETDAGLEDESLRDLGIFLYKTVFSPDASLVRLASKSERGPKLPS